MKAIAPFVNYEHMIFFIYNILDHDRSLDGVLGRGPWTGSLGGVLGRGPWTGSLGGVLGRGSSRPGPNIAYQSNGVRDTFKAR